MKVFLFKLTITFQFYEHILREYIFPWYGQVSLDDEFVQEIRSGLRFATSVLVKRIGRVRTLLKLWTSVSDIT